MNLFDFIKSQVAVLDVIREYTALKQAGIYWKGLCPFHSEKTSSFTVSPHKDIFYCFGCHANGDVISFISQIENCSQIDAAKFIVERYNLNVPEEANNQFQQAAESSDKKQRYFELCKLVAEWCALNLDKNSSAQEYLERRSVSPKVINNFEIGYFPKGPSGIQNLIKFIQSNNHLTDDLIEAQILQRGNRNLYSPFEDRIMFPIQDHIGRHCGFGGRVFQPGDERAKYYNSHEHQFFSKGNLLFGLSLAKKEIQKTGTVFLTEGYTDCITMAQHGYKNSVATLGTSCTAEHIALLARLTEKVYVIYDSDAAGYGATIRLTELCWNANLEIKVIKLPPKEDPDSYLNEHKSLESLINNAQDIYNFIIESSSQNFGSQTLSKKVAISNKITSMISKVQDPLKRNLLLQEATQTLGISIQNLKRQHTPKLKTSDSTESSDSAPIKHKLEEKLFAIFIHQPELFEPKYYYLASYLGSPAKEVLQKLIQIKESEDKPNFEVIMAKLSEDEQIFVRKAILTYNENIVGSIQQTLNQFHQKHWKNIVSHVKNLLSQAKSDHNKVKQIIDRFQTLKAEIFSGGIQS